MIDKNNIKKYIGSVIIFTEPTITYIGGLEISHINIKEIIVGDIEYDEKTERCTLLYHEIWKHETKSAHFKMDMNFLFETIGDVPDVTKKAHDNFIKIKELLG